MNEKQINENENAHLKYYSQLANNEEKEDFSIDNMTMYTFFYNMFYKLSEILNELILLDNMTIKNIFLILSKDNRLIYVGVYLMFVSLLFIFI